MSYDKNGEDWGLDELLVKSDVVSVHITADEENRDWFNKEKFEQMKDGAILLNSSRAWLIEESSFQNALESGKISAAWSDFPVDFSHKNLTVTEHLGGTTIESRRKSEMLLAEKIKRIYVNE